MPTTLEVTCQMHAALLGGLATLGGPSPVMLVTIGSLAQQPNFMETREFLFRAREVDGWAASINYLVRGLSTPATPAHIIHPGPED